jgi:hypothetical protein
LALAARTAPYSRWPQDARNGTATLPDVRRVPITRPDF